MAENRQQRGLLQVVRMEPSARPASPQVQIGNVGRLPDLGATQSFAQSEAALGSIAEDLGKIGKEVGAIGDHAARVEGERAGRLAGLDPEFKPGGDLTIRGEAFDRAGLEVYKSTARLEIEADLEKGGDIEAKRRAWISRVPQDMVPDVEHMFRRHTITKSREATRQAAARAATEAAAAQSAELDRQMRGLHQRAYALGVDETADQLLAGDFAMVERALRRAGPDGKPMLTPSQVNQQLGKLREVVADARLLGAFERLPTVEAKEEMLRKIEDDFKAGTGIAGVYDLPSFLRVRRQLEAQSRSAVSERNAQQNAALEEIKSAQKLAEKGYSLTPDQIAGFRARVATNPALAPHVEMLEELIGWQAGARPSRPDDIDAYAARLEDEMRVRGPNQRAAQRVEMARKLATEARTQLQQNPLGWAERVGLMRIAPIDWSSPEAASATVSARIAQAEEVARHYRQAPVYLTPAEKRQLAHVASQGGATMLGVSEGITRAAGERAPRILAEVFPASPVVAMVGGHVASVGGRHASPVADDIADGVALSRTEGFKPVAPSPSQARELAVKAHQGALSRLPETEQAAIATANAAYEVRARRANLTEFSEELWARTFREVMGERRIGARTYGGIEPSGYGTAMVPANVVQGGVRQLVEALRQEDFGEAAPAYTDGRAADLADVRRAKLVSVGEGRYWLNLGSADAPRYLHDVTQPIDERGRHPPFVLDLKALEPVLRQRRPDLYEGGERIPPPGAVRERRNAPAGMMRLGGPMEDAPAQTGTLNDSAAAGPGVVDVGRIDTPGARALWQDELTLPQLRGVIKEHYPDLERVLDMVLKDAAEVGRHLGLPPEAFTDRAPATKWGYALDPDSDMKPPNWSARRWQNFLRMNDFIKRSMERAPAGKPPPEGAPGGNDGKPMSDAGERRVLAGMMRLGGPTDDVRDGLPDGFRPRFGRGSGDLSATGEDTAENWRDLTQPYREAFGVFARALDAAMGRGEGVTDDEIREAGLVLAGLATTGSLGFARPGGSLGAGGRPRFWTDDKLAELQQLRAQGLSHREIGDRLGASSTQLKYALQEYDMPLRREMGFLETPRNKLPDLTDDVMEKVYEMRSRGVQVKRIAADLGLDPVQLKNRLSYEGVTMRSLGLERSAWVWTESTIEKLIELRGKGLTRQQVADQLGVSLEGLNSAMRRFRITERVMLGGPDEDDTPEMDARSLGVPQPPEIGPTVGLPPELRQGIDGIVARRKLDAAGRQRLDDLLFTDHFLEGLDALEDAADDATRGRILKRLLDDIERSLERRR